MKNLYPTQDYLILDMIEQNDSPSKIILPEGTDKQKAGLAKFKCRLVGPDVKMVKAGDEVYSCIPVGRGVVDGQAVFVVQEKHIMFFVREESNCKVTL